MCSRRQDREMKRILRELEALSIYDRCFQPCGPPPSASPAPALPTAAPVPVDGGASSEGTSSSGFHAIAPDPRRRARLEQQQQRSESIYAEREATRQAAHYEVTPGGDALGGSTHGMTEDDVRRRRLAAMRKARRSHVRSASLPCAGSSSASGDGPLVPRDPALARLADVYGESEAMYALRCMGSEEEAQELLQTSLEGIRANLNEERQALYSTYKVLLSMLWQAPNALPRARRLLVTLLHAARQARRDPTKCRIRAANAALQAKVLWTPAGDELLRWLGFEASEREDVYTITEEERTSYIMEWRIQLLQGTLRCVIESPILLQAFLEDEVQAASGSAASAQQQRRERTQSEGGGATTIAAEEGDGGDAEPPNEFICPISLELMEDPVVLLESGMTYDRAWLQQWFARGAIRDPLTNLPMASAAVAPNHALRGRIEAWKARHG